MQTYRSIISFGIGIIILLFFIGNQCPLENIVGVPCPGCNMFTALYWLLIKGDILTAMYYHPMVIPLIGYLLGLAIMYFLYRENLVERRLFKVISIFFISLLLGVYLYRMWTIFPNAPMQLNEQSIFMKIFHLI